MSSANDRLTVVFKNNANEPNSNWLASFMCNVATIDNRDYQCDINLHNVDQTSPPGGTSLSTPTTFTWAARSTTTDNYAWELADQVIKTSNQMTQVMQSPLLGYTDEYALSSLPTTLKKNYTYWWRVNVVTPDGVGLGFWYFSVLFK